MADARAGHALPDVSFEFFPPKTPEMKATLWDTVCALAPIGPAFVSVTYGAGGSGRRTPRATTSRSTRMRSARKSSRRSTRSVSR